MRTKDIPEEVYEKAEAAWHGTLADARKKHGVRIVIARAIMEERERIADIIAAEREYGDCHPDDINKRLWSGERPRLMSGWNAHEDEDGNLVEDTYP